MISATFFIATLCLFLESANSAHECSTPHQLRLTNGTFGEVQICLRGTWEYICDDRWTNTNAQVVCRLMEQPHLFAYKTVETHFQNHSLINEPSIVLDDVRCYGNESKLTHCFHAGIGLHNCEASELAGAVCSGPEPTCTAEEQGDVRLVGSRSTRQGVVEICHHLHWGLVCDDHWDYRDATVVCNQLGYTYKEPEGLLCASNLYNIESSFFWLDDVDCKGDESGLLECAHGAIGKHDCTNKELAGARCEESVLPKPVANCSDIAGSVYSECVCQSVCGEEGMMPCEHDCEPGCECPPGTSLDKKEEKCVERCPEEPTPSPSPPSPPPSPAPPSPSPAPPSPAPPSPSPDPPSPPPSPTPPSPSPDPPSPPPSPMPCPFVGQQFSRCACETVCGEPKLPCDECLPGCQCPPGTFLDTAAGRCVNECPYQTNTPSPSPLPPPPSPSPSPIGPNNCTIAADGTIRLVGGEDSSQGEVEVCYNREWRFVCDDYWTDHEAEVVCKSLGFPPEGSKATTRSHFKYEFEPVDFWLDDVFCVGDESSLFDCIHRAIGSHNCRAYEQAGAICQAPERKRRQEEPCGEDGAMQLVSGSKESEGSLLFCYLNEWRHVCDDSWDKKAAKVVCRALGYSPAGAQATKSSTFITNSTVVEFWLDDVQCNGDEMSLLDCNHAPLGVDNCQFSERAGVRCKGPFTDPPPILPSSGSGIILPELTLDEAAAVMTGSGISGIIYFSRVGPNNISINTTDLLGLNATEEYGWHIHTEPINESAPADRRCETAGPHYDPENIRPTSCNYGKDCNTNYPMNCEVGDLSGRLGHLHGSGMHTLFFTMVDFDEIIGLSVVVHNEAQTRIACGTIKEIEDAET